MDEIITGLQQAEYVHVILNHLPIIGLMTGLLVLVVAFFQKSQATRFAGYIVVLLMALSIIPVIEYGEKAEDQVESLMDDAGRHWLHEHGSRADRVEWLYWVTAGAAAGGLFVPRRWPKTAPLWLVGTFLAGSLALAGGVWTASAGGKIMHHEFRYAAPEKSSD